MPLVLVMTPRFDVECRLLKRFYSPDPSPDIRDYQAFVHKSTFSDVAMQYESNTNPLFTPR